MDVAAGSRTARVVAVGRAIGVAGTRDDTVVDLLSGADRAAVRAGRRLGLGRARRALAPVAHPSLRMQAVDDAVRAAVARADPATVVVVGAGYDTRAWRLPCLAGRTVVEVDHPATQAAKRAGAAADEALADVVFAGADLARADLDRVLAAAGHDPNRATVWLWEAVVPYLDEAAVDATLAVLAARSTPGSVLLLTSVTPQLFTPELPGVRGPARWCMARLGEPIRLAESDAAVAARLDRHGFDHDQVSTPPQWAAAVGVRLHGPQLTEHLHVAVRSDR